ncbi:Pescadillo N-terminus-domain-containing protein [Dichotomocladium elegans]|nr:Pescadillo N-terminus-domain-containing protein [Dichotomocladium elegans]
MGKLLKKGKKGAAANFITRQQAIKKLQITLADFRRLCILKGIYPRQPRNHKKANKGSTAPATFYYVKDIQYLLHEPLLEKFRQYKTFARKLQKVLHKGDYSSAKSLQENHKPVYTLDHVVKERYPSFVDALRDLDDAISMLFLFSKMPADNKIKSQVVHDSQRLVAEFQAYVMKSRSLRKVFFSIKGIYYQAEIKGQTITWVVPYQFSQAVPTDVDFRVMLTFLEFYITLMGFVNYRLYNELNINYPPKLESTNGGGIQLDDIPMSLKQADANGGDADGVTEEAEALDEFKTVGGGDGEEQEDAGAETLRQIQEHSNEVSSLRNLFSNCVFFLSRETPRYALEFMITSCGGRVSWDETVGPNPPFSESDERITHQICDRPVVRDRILSRTYIQPQWVADCINRRRIVKASLYEPGKVLPPHLSPFVEVKEGDYVPDDIEEEEDTEENTAADTKQPVDEDEDEVYEQELKAEAAGVTFSEYQGEAKSDEKAGGQGKKRSAAEIEEAEQKEMAQSMMSNKQRKLYKIMKATQKRKADEAAKLESKKKAIKESKK